VSPKVSLTLVYLFISNYRFPRHSVPPTTTVENEEHCDFKKLRSLLIRSYMLDLVTTTEENHYESYRLAQMETRKFGEPKVKKLDNPKYREEEELLRKRFTEQVKMEEARFRQWEQHVSHRTWPGCLAGPNLESTP
jgi:septin family protein